MKMSFRQYVLRRSFWSDREKRMNDEKTLGNFFRILSLTDFSIFKKLSKVFNFKPMKKFYCLAFTAVVTVSNGQSYSTFYGTYNVNQNINVSGKIETESTIHTIDYAALAQANALAEANRLKSKQYRDKRAQQIGESIAENPINAYTYGYPRLLTTLRSWAKNRGLKPKYGVFFVAPNNALFDSYEYNSFRNVSSSGIITEFSIQLPMELQWPYTSEKVRSLYSDEELAWYTSWVTNPRGAALNEGLERGVEYTWGFLHDMELYTALVYGKEGFRGTLKYEDEFHIFIEDTYVANLDPYGGILVRASYKGDKRKHTFEELEGRRYYLQPLIEKTIGNAKYPRTKRDMRIMGIYSY